MFACAVVCVQTIGCTESSTVLMMINIAAYTQALGVICSSEKPSQIFLRPALIHCIFRCSHTWIACDHWHCSAQLRVGAHIDIIENRCARHWLHCFLHSAGYRSPCLLARSTAPTPLFRWLGRTLLRSIIIGIALVGLRELPFLLKFHGTKLYLKVSFKYHEQ